MTITPDRIINIIIVLWLLAGPAFLAFVWWSLQRSRRRLHEEQTATARSPANELLNRTNLIQERVLFGVTVLLNLVGAVVVARRTIPIFAEWDWGGIVFPILMLLAYLGLGLFLYLRNYHHHNLVGYLFGLELRERRHQTGGQDKVRQEQDNARGRQDDVREQQRRRD